MESTKFNVKIHIQRNSWYIFWKEVERLRIKKWILGRRSSAYQHRFIFVQRLHHLHLSARTHKHLLHEGRMKRLRCKTRIMMLRRCLSTRNSNSIAFCGWAIPLGLCNHYYYIIYCCEIYINPLRWWKKEARIDRVLLSSSILFSAGL